MRCQEIYSQRPALACLLVFRSARTATVQASHLRRPGVFNVVLIFQTQASPFCFNLIKVASCLWPANLMLEREWSGQPGLAWFKRKELDLQQRNISSVVLSWGQKEAGILWNIKRVCFISIIRPYVLQISSRISCWCTSLKWQAHYTHYHLKAYVSFE